MRPSSHRLIDVVAGGIDDELRAHPRRRRLPRTREAGHAMPAPAVGPEGARRPIGEREAIDLGFGIDAQTQRQGALEPPAQLHAAVVRRHDLRRGVARGEHLPALGAEIPPRIETVALGDLLQLGRPRQQAIVERSDLAREVLPVVVVGHPDRIDRVVQVAAVDASRRAQSRPASDRARPLGRRAGRRARCGPGHRARGSETRFPTPRRAASARPA